MNEDARCRMLLGVGESCTNEELRQAYLDMVKVWHPDRFMHDERLRQIAQDKLKEINGAYEFLRARLFEESITPQSDDSAETAPQEATHGSGGRSVLWPSVSVVCLLILGFGAYQKFGFHNKQPARAAVIAATEQSSNSVSQDSDWRILFDGASVDHWRAFRRGDFPGGNWEVQNGVLQTIAGSDPVDLISREDYQDFELELEWRISPGGNSGIMFHVSEDVEKPWFSGPEMQLLDDKQHPDGLNAKTSAGSLFDVIAPVNKHLNPVGEWNSTRILVSGSHVEYRLNGLKVVEYELGSEKFKQLVANSQFRDVSSYARQKSGHIVLQAYERQIGFRNIRIRRLPSPPENVEP